MEYVKKVGLAFLFGGAVAMITEILFQALAFVPVNPYEQSLLALVSVAFLGTLLQFLGVYAKFVKIFGFGAMLPIAGLPPAIAGAIARLRGENAPTAQIIKKGFLPVAYVLLFGIGFAVLYAVILTLLI
ncbi:MAG TPA: SpoVA/SpoVAEb family sporulation membrane protein [Clostridiales bacterium]|nr:SpoVA/SpoVAEb family sporulation membrane protein [Clostridiales bacterium]